ncbi:MAG TPA: DUF2631 domain-containing protein [Cryptosporangiaceae bacterium]|nr:DUF2631 domain-containing protein [Cryptosporangiaceae bacterium]
MADEPVIAPDQLRPGHPKLWRGAAVVTAVALVLTLFGNHEGRIENIFVVLTAALLIGALIVDAVLRRYGIKR